MVALGLGTFWLGYTVTMYGYCLVRGYNVKFTDLFHSTWPGAVQGKPVSKAIQQARTVTGSGQVDTIGGHT
jgi:hypothetical protein